MSYSCAGYGSAGVLSVEFFRARLSTRTRALALRSFRWRSLFDRSSESLLRHFLSLIRVVWRTLFNRQSQV